MPLGERLQFLSDSWAMRVDGACETAFVMNGLDSNLISLRRGVSYWEAIEQLVPRTFWPDKPEFNLETNHVLAQTIRLVGPADNDTSWCVNFLAETVWNFGLVSLLVALPVTFTLSTWLDRALHGWLKHPVALLVVEGALFFKFVDGGHGEHDYLCVVDLCNGHSRG